MLEGLKRGEEVHNNGAQHIFENIGVLSLYQGVLLAVYGARFEATNPSRPSPSTDWQVLTQYRWNSCVLRTRFAILSRHLNYVLNGTASWDCITFV